MVGANLPMTPSAGPASRRTGKATCGTGTADIAVIWDGPRLPVTPAEVDLLIRLLGPQLAAVMDDMSDQSIEGPLRPVLH